MNYVLVDIEDSIDKTITKTIKSLCKENKINYEKQQYKILFCSEKIFFKNNNVRFTSGSSKDLSFYGKVYLNKTGKIAESIYIQDKAINLEPNTNNLLVISGGIDNSTIVDHDESLLHFYVAPSYLLELQDQKLWQSI